jgi:hypothetical protein
MRQSDVFSGNSASCTAFAGAVLIRDSCRRFAMAESLTRFVPFVSILGNRRCGRFVDGVVLAHNISRAELETRVPEDHFVVENVVSADILEVTPGRTDDRLAFLKA